MSKITKGHSLPDVDVVFESYKFNFLHEHIMDAATIWAKSKVYTYGQEKHIEASSYITALMLVIAGGVTKEVCEGIYDEYKAMLYGKRTMVEVSNEKTLES